LTKSTISFGLALVRKLTRRKSKAIRSKDIEKLCEDYGITYRTYERLKKRLGLRVYRKGGVWWTGLTG